MTTTRTQGRKGRILLLLLAGLVLAIAAGAAGIWDLLADPQTLVTQRFHQGLRTDHLGQEFSRVPTHYAATAVGGRRAKRFGYRYTTVHFSVGPNGQPEKGGGDDLVVQGCSGLILVRVLGGPCSWALSATLLWFSVFPFGTRFRVPELALTCLGPVVIAYALLHRIHWLLSPAPDPFATSWDPIPFTTSWDRARVVLSALAPAAIISFMLYQSRKHSRDTEDVPPALSAEGTLPIG